VTAQRARAGALFLLAVSGCGASRGKGAIAVGERDDARTTQIFRRSADGTGRTPLTVGPEEHWMPAWSPDGRRLACVSRTSRGMKIEVMDEVGANRRTLTGAGVALAPSWSPDGQSIVYAYTAVPGTPFKVWVMRPDGTGQRPITTGSSDDNVPTWSPEGTRIAFTSNREGGRYRIWVMDADGGNARALTTAYYDLALHADIEQKVPAWSPDGRYIAYWSGVEATDRRPGLPRDVWVMSADGTSPRRLAPGDDPAWSPDSALVLYPAVSGPDGRIGVGVIAPDGTNARVLFYTNGDFGRISWQPVR
jgi:Tol biopolymer transport system component